VLRATEQVALNTEPGDLMIKDKERLVLEIVKLVLGDDKPAMSRVAFQIIEICTGVRKRISSKRKPKE